MQQTFDIQRRLKKWISNANDWNVTKKPKASAFKKLPGGLFKAFCIKCGKKNMPNEFQLKQNSSCCGVEFVPERPIIIDTSKQDKKVVEELGWVESD